MIRFKFLVGAVVLMGATVALAAPTTAPSETPAAASVASPASYSSVLVLPFAPVAGASDWIGKGIQEDLATELVRQSRLDVLTPTDAQPVVDAAAAAKIGQEKGASLVAFGTYQILETDVRINGQLIDTTTGKPLAALKATGPRRDLFHMEDLLASQAVASLPPASIKLGGGAFASNNEAPAPPAQSGNYATQPYNSEGYYVTPGPTYAPSSDYGAAAYAPQTTYDGGYSPYAQTYPYDNYPYDYGYGYGYPFWGDGFLVIGGFGGGRFHDRDHDRGRGGRWYNGTESHHVGGFAGVSGRSDSPAEVSSGRSMSGGGFARPAPAFNSAGGSGFRSTGSFGFRGGGGFHSGGGFGGGFHGGGGGHR